jgi:pimeloyl-ACP methyl ester carboxylesterase
VKADNEIQAFKISINQSVLDDLYNRLSHTRWARETTPNDWEYGTNSKYLHELTEYWINSYDWRKHEAELNKFAQYKTKIDNTEIHFIHERSTHSDSMPLLLLHGWPDSFYLYHKIIHSLTDSFHVVVPSLPGFGFSDKVAMSGDATAEIMAKLMSRLGYTGFAVAGGDLGANVASAMAVMFPENVKGIHLTLIFNYPTGREDFSKLTEAERRYVSQTQQWMFTQGAYVMMHSTKPQSLAQGLNDSPTGLAAWMLSYIDTDAQNHDVEHAFGSRDEFLTNLMIYWATETIGSAIRTYAENARSTYTQPGGPKSAQKSTVPAYISLFPRGVQVPREWAERTLNVQRFAKMPRGGHFAPLEEPELYTQEIRAAFTKIPSVSN